MKKNRLIVIYIFILISSCNVKRIDWLLDLKKSQTNNNVIPKYFIDFGYRKKVLLEKN